MSLNNECATVKITPVAESKFLGDVKEYQAKHDKDTALIRADIPDDGWYKDRIKSLTTENVKLREENAALKKELHSAERLNECSEMIRSCTSANREEDLVRGIKERDIRISKLERALIEANLR